VVVLDVFSLRIEYQKVLRRIVSWVAVDVMDHLTFFCLSDQASFPLALSAFTCVVGDGAAVVVVALGGAVKGFVTAF